MMVIAFGLFLLLPLVLLITSLGRTAVGMSRGPQADVPSPQPTAAPTEPAAPVLALVEAPTVAAEPAPVRKRFRRRRGAGADYFGDATTSRLRNQVHVAAPAVDREPAVAEAPVAPRPVVIPAPAPVFARAADTPVAVTRPIAPAGAEARLALR